MAKIIQILLAAYFLLFPLGQLFRLPLSGNFLPPAVNLYLTDVVVTLLLGLWLVWRFFFVKRPYRLPVLAKPIAVFVLVAAFSLAVNAARLTGVELLVSGLYLGRFLILAGLYLVIADLKWPGQKWLVWAGVATAVLGLGQYFLWPDIRPLQTAGWDPHYYRVVGTLLDPGFTGLILVLTLILLACRFEEKKKLFAILFSLVYVALALTYSRSSYLAYLVGMTVIAWVKKAPRFLLMVILAGVLTLMVLPRQSGGEGVNLQRQSTIAARLTNWRHALEIIADRPILGVGFNAYRYAQRDYGFLEADWQTTHAGAGADASLLFVWATTGVLGLLVYLRFWLKAVRSKNLIVTASVTALFAHAVFLNSLFYPWVMAWLWTLLATENS